MKLSPKILSLLSAGGNGVLILLVAMITLRAGRVLILACTHPLLVADIKKTNKVATHATFALSTVYIILFGYNRIHMGKHFLTDVSFGILLANLVYALVDQGFQLFFKN